MDELQTLGRKFHFDKSFFDKPIRFRFIELYQVGEMHCELGYHIEKHEQDCHEISYIVSGEGVFKVNDIEYHVGEGDLFITRKGETHEIYASESTSLRFFYLGFLFDETKYEQNKKLYDFYNKSDDVKKEDKRNILSIFIPLIDELYNQIEYSQVLIENYLENIIVLTYRNFIETEVSRLTPELSVNSVGSAVYSVIKYIDKHFDEIGKISTIAKDLGYSYNYLSRLFKGKTGMTLQNYIRNKKIEKSLELLDSERFSITEVAMKLKYDTVQSFSKAFKRTLNISPSEYQKGK